MVKSVTRKAKDAVKVGDPVVADGAGEVSPAPVVKRPPPVAEPADDMPRWMKYRLENGLPIDGGE